MKEKPTPVLTQERYEEVASRIEELKNAPPDSEEAKELMLLTKLLVNFESSRLERTPSKPIRH